MISIQMLLISIQTFIGFFRLSRDLAWLTKVMIMVFMPLLTTLAQCETLHAKCETF